MPIFRNLRRVRLTWQREAKALRRCARSITPAVWANSRTEARCPSHHERIRADTAVWIWHTVHAGFFFPQASVRASKEQVSGC